MFDSVNDLDAAATVAGCEVTQRTVVVESCRTLVLAAHGADLYPAEGIPAQRVPGQETPRHPGGEGTPGIAGFAPAELGPVLGAAAGAASRLIGDALDLRHRLPLCWRRVVAGEVPGHHARRVAQATRHLSREAAARVDSEIAQKLTALSYGRLDTGLEAAVYQADPAAAEAEAELAMRERFVRLGRTSKFGLKLIIARVTAGDGLYVNAMVTRLAEILRRRGDLDPLEVRRSKAFGLLGHPAEALRLLHEHAEPEEPDPSEEPDHERDAKVDAEDRGDDATGDDPAGDDPAGDDAAGDDPAGDDPAGDDAAGDDAADVDSDTEMEDQEGPEPDPDADHRSVTIIPPPFDPAKARPSTIIYVHLSEEALAVGRGVARMEGIGPVLLTQLRRLLGEQTTIKVQPVIDLNDEPAPVDCYEIPDRMREHLILANPADRFPYAGGMARGPDRNCDLDHTIPYRTMAEGGPPGQTRVDRLAPLARYHHRVRTHSSMQIRQPEAGTVVWRSPHGRIYLVNNSGTHPLGAGPFAHAIWHAAAPQLELAG